MSKRKEGKIKLFNDKLLDKYLQVVSSLQRESNRSARTESVLFPFHKAGPQFIADFSVTDLDKKDKPQQVNWHLQNTSRWLWAGCIRVEGEEVAIHT